MHFELKCVQHENLFSEKGWHPFLRLEANWLQPRICEESIGKSVALEERRTRTLRIVAGLAIPRPIHAEHSSPRIGERARGRGILGCDPIGNCGRPSRELKQSSWLTHNAISRNFYYYPTYFTTPSVCVSMPNNGVITCNTSRARCTGRTLQSRCVRQILLKEDCALTVTLDAPTSETLAK